MSFLCRSLIPACAAAALPLLACTKYDPLYCDAKTKCTDPDRPFCDLAGDYPASDGVARTCIPDPNTQADAGSGGAGDPGNPDGGSPSDDAATKRRITQISTGASHTCVVLSDGGLRCWGKGISLGYPDAVDIGDDEHPYQAGDVPTGGKVKQVAAGSSFTCALYEAGNIRCWGFNHGLLGYGHEDDLFGPGNTPDLLPDVDVGGPASQIVTGGSHTCALLESGDVRCWGVNGLYELGTGDQVSVGDNEVPGSRSPVLLGDKATSISTSDHHTCALVEGGFVRCWGIILGPPATGPIGYGGAEIVGDDEALPDLGNINVGGSALAVAAGQAHTCVLLSEGRVRCWGIGHHAKEKVALHTLGYQENEDIGDDEPPASAGNVDVGGQVVELATAGSARCARLTSGSVRCWGTDLSTTGVLGHANGDAIGDDEAPAAAGNVEIGGSAVLLSSGGPTHHMCALLDDDSLRCWGSNSLGELGLGSTDNVGDDETPADVDPIRVFE
jgi:alpha-tubulin suppressor-like RCC1 family protein